MPFTHGHAIVNVWLLDRFRRRNQTTTTATKSPLPSFPPAHHRGLLWASILLGGVIPDVPLLVFMLIEIPKHGASEAFDVIYFESQTWQRVFGYAHGIPLSLLVWILCLLLYCYLLAREEHQEEKSFKKVVWNYFISVWSCRRRTKEDAASFEQNATDARRQDEEDVDEEAGTTAHEQHATEKQQQPSSSSISIILMTTTYCIALCSASIFLHSFADFWLHTEDAHQHLLPLSTYKFHSPISYYNVEEYSWIWAPIEAMLVWWACRYLWKDLRQKEEEGEAGTNASSSSRCSCSCCFRWLVLVLVALSYVLILGSTLVGAIRLIA